MPPESRDAIEHEGGASIALRSGRVSENDTVGPAATEGEMLRAILKKMDRVLRAEHSSSEIIGAPKSSVSRSLRRSKNEHNGGPIVQEIQLGSHL